MPPLSAVYPFATQDGQAIPLDILKPNGLLVVPFTAASAKSITLPASAVVGMFISSEACFVSFEHDISAITIDIFLPKVLLVPFGSTVSSSIPAQEIQVKGADKDGTLYIQLIEQWAGLALAHQYSRK